MNRYLMDDNTQNNSIKTFYYILFRHIKKIVLFFFLVVIGVVAFTFLQPEIYRSDAKLLMRIGRESVTLDPTATTGTTGQTISIAQDRKSEINTGVEIIRSRELAEKLVDALGPETILEKPDEKQTVNKSKLGLVQNSVRGIRKNIRSAVAAPESILADLDLYDALQERDKAVLVLINNLDVQVEKSSDIISISYEARSANTAKNVINGLINLYLEKHIAMYRPKGSRDFFDVQTNLLLNNIASWEDSLRQVKNSTGFAAIKEQRTILIERIGNLQKENELNSALIAVTRSKIQSFEVTIADLPTMVSIEKVTGNEYMRSDLFRLQMKEQDLISQFSEIATPVKEVRRQIAEVKSRLEENPQINLGINTNRQQMELNLMTEKATLSSILAKDKSLQILLSDANTELRNLNDSEANISNLERNIEIKENIFKKYSDSLEQSRIDEALQLQQISNISVVQEATHPMKPVRPKKMLNITLGLFLGLFGGIGLAFFAESIDHSIKSQEDVENKLELNTLSTIPSRSRKRA